MGKKREAASSNDRTEAHDDSTAPLKRKEAKTEKKKKISKGQVEEESAVSNEPPKPRSIGKKAKKQKKATAEEVDGKSANADAEEKEAEVDREADEQSKPKKKKRKAVASDESHESETTKVTELVDNGDGEKQKKRKKVEQPAPEDHAEETESPKKKKKTKANVEHVEADNLLDEQHEIENGNIAPQNGAEDTTMNEEEDKRKKRNSNVPFQRVDASAVSFIDDRLKDNSFTAKIGAESSYGLKAHQDLIVTRGKGFRTEKNKKKRGSYRGGKIDMGSHSIKFNFD
ncbi:SRP40, C-terminal domain-containing protein [Cladochytrium replicatum]|nr:SRP40, C-terminal domain-containing protein [Cladochytrium replicatum]